MSAIHQIAALMGRKAKATGGTVTYTATHTVHTFTSSGTFTALQDVAINYLLVGGGGGGSAGGGGGGGLLKAESGGVFLAAGGYSITVGTGGNGAASGSSAAGSNGVDTTFNGLTAVGGGGGAGSGGTGSSGGSGGGGNNTGTGGAGTGGQGSAGGTAPAGTTSGGGGAGAVGANGVGSPSYNAGNGGVGVQSSITGAATYYAGGGGGGNPGGSQGAGGAGGGGNGSTSNTTSGFNGTNGFGGGGGGRWGTTGTTGGNGGSGVVIISYPSYYDYSLLLDFANSQTVDPSITFTRASSATRVNSSGTIVTASTDVARIDYDPVTLACKGLLIEEARTNLLTYSEQFDNAAWTKSRTTISANATTAPDGAVTADTIIEDTTASNTHQCNLTTSSLTSGTAYTVSLFVKAASGTRYIALTLGGTAYASAVTAVFTLNESVAPSVTGSGTGAIQNVGNGWFRVSLTATAQASGTALLIYYLSNAATAGGLTYTGDGTSGVYIWGAQLEAGACASSYIPTTSAQVTRAADAASITGTNFSSWYRQDEGAFLLDASLIGTAAPGALSLLSFQNAGVTDYMSIRQVTASVGADLLVVNNSSITVDTVTTAFTAGQRKVFTVGYANNNLSYVANGTVIENDTSCAFPTTNAQTEMQINFGGASSYHIYRIAYYPSRLSSATLQALSTP